MLLAGFALLAGCSGRTDVSLSGNTPAQYSHFWITSQEVWLNRTSGAGPEDGGWKQFPLSTPVTVDLVQQTGGNLASVFTDLKLLPDTYSEIRFIPVDPSMPLTASAQAAGAIYNSEADYVDASGTTHQLPLELLNPEQGFGIQASLKVPIGNIGAALKTLNTASTRTSSTTGSTGTTTTTPATTATALTNSNSTPRNHFTIHFDGTSDLVPFTYSSAKTTAILLSAHATAYDLTEVGGISGQLTLTNLIGISGNSGTPAIQVTAELLSADGTRHQPVLSTPVDAQGNFLLYPLATSKSSPAYYDVVIHGPGMATIIIKSVQVTLSSSAATPTASSSGSSSTTTTSSTTTNSTINSVSLGTLIPRAASSYTANLTTTPAQSLPAGALIGFYQTLATTGEVPYLIELSPIDPFNQVLFNAQALSEGTIDSGTFTASGANVRVVSAAPTEGAGSYIVSATAANFTPGALTTVVSAPPAGTTTPVLVTVPSLTLAAGATAGTISASLSVASPGRYNQGELLVSHEGRLVATAPLDAAFAHGAGGTVTVAVPAETASSLYYLTVRAWNSNDPAGTLQSQSYSAALDLRSTATGSTELTVN